jgi:hypothetical protein
MSTKDLGATTAPAPTAAVESQEEDLRQLWQRVVGRRSFLRGVGVAGAAALPAAALLEPSIAAAAAQVTSGDVAILRFLAAAEIIETDLWTQYAELGGVNGGNPAYMAALQNLDSDMPQYIADNTDDEHSHEKFLNAYLKSVGAEPVDLDGFRTLKGSQATGAGHRPHITNLQALTVDTSWYTRYRGAKNPDFGATFPQAVTIKNQPAIPLNDTDTPPNTKIPSPSVPPTASKAARRMQAIANTAGFHFAFIEQGGARALKCSSVEALRIVVSIGGVETNHFSLWHDKAGNAVAQPLADVTDPETGLHFPDLNALHSDLFQTNLILPEPCEFLSPSLPRCSIVRPTLDANAGAQAAVKALTADGLFKGQTPEFFAFVTKLAVAADAAQRQVR